MTYSMQLMLTVSSLLSSRLRPEDGVGEAATPAADLSDVLEPAHQRLRELAEDFLAQPVSPARTQQFEQHVQEAARELGRTLVQHTYNQLEPSDVGSLPPHVRFEAGPYTRLTRKTPQNAWTLFGQIKLWRVGYRPSDKSGEPTIFPLALALGLVEGASPALASQVALLHGAAGATQRRTLQRLRQDHGVGWGVKKLRQVVAALAEAAAQQRHPAQVEKLLELLVQASASTGKHKPVLSVGRDGITLGLRYRRLVVSEVASTATVSVSDRRGRRLGTVYLAFTPESGQPTMSRELTRLLRDVLTRWQGPLPRLCYVTDAGDNETAYYANVLKRFKHPRSGVRLEWVRVVDYYHASQRIWTMAELLFGKGRQATTWARKMLRWLLKPGGVNRVLHSAVALRELYGLGKNKRADFRTAYRYLSTRMAYLNYHEYRRQGLPLGSGVTEAGCKTVYTQRLKLSGMRWKKPGAQTILNLRVLQLSDVWEDAFQRFLEQRPQPTVGGPPLSQENTGENAA
jgi:hypothetical protein